ncbi:hypothetical protein SCLCIDRAFT_16140 [Scleroderma citrinum Foug A]|uniref:CxC1-like cysteine cluster associated with KDZ transposases domain-containing protein n=1 Tax=Scleroderma citrinum Foug A TaxID=1036808 RepID=A0A0C2ZIB2_9AGAM|nr:hypothetical protein SCLCIDRAFT_16140 [Scleroderma citrinum Foug A]
MLHPMPHHQYPNEVLLCHGYLGSAPIYPMVAISICALALFHQVHCACPRYSIQSFCKTLCYIHQVPYRAYLTTQLNMPDWRLLNSCPACCYKLKDEPPLDFQWLVSIDGNNSLK